MTNTPIEEKQTELKYFDQFKLIDIKQKHK